jgi:hypothetical protein
MILQTLWENLVETLFHAAPGKKYRILEWAGICALFLGGLFLWGSYLNWGRGPYNFHDWEGINMPRLAFLQDAMLKGQMPLHISEIAPLAYATDRFLAIPDVIVSPQIVLLRFMDVGTFVLVNTWLLYALGFWGLARIRARYHLSLIAFTLLFLLYNFNGHILAHYTSGHITWWSYFLYSWFGLWILELLEDGGGWRWIAKMSFLMFAIFIQGGYHQFIWGLLFLGLLGIANRRLFWPMLKTALFSVGLGLARILPVAMLTGKFDNGFIAGYPLTSSLWDALTVVAIPSDVTLSGGMTRAVGMWEFTLYIGFFGAIFLLGFGTSFFARRWRECVYTPLIVPIVGLIVLSFGKVYQYLRIALPIPLLTGERVSSRMIILAFVIVSFVAVIELQGWMNAHRAPIVRWSVLAGVILIANDLWQNYRMWRITTAVSKYVTKNLDLSIYTVANHPDPAYFQMLGLGFGLLLVIAAALIWLALRERRRELKRVH